MKALLVLLLSAPLLANTIGYVTEYTQGTYSYSLTVANTSNKPFGITYHVLDINGIWQDIGFGKDWPDNPVLPGNGQTSGFGNFVTTGNWYATIITDSRSWRMTGWFAPIGESLTFQIVIPEDPPPTPAPEPSVLVLLPIGLSALRWAYLH